MFCNSILLFDFFCILSFAFSISFWFVLFSLPSCPPFFPPLPFSLSYPRLFLSSILFFFFPPSLSFVHILLPSLLFLPSSLFSFTLLIPSFLFLSSLPLFFSSPHSLSSFSHLFSCPPGYFFFPMFLSSVTTLPPSLLFLFSPLFSVCILPFSLLFLFSLLLYCSYPPSISSVPILPPTLPFLPLSYFILFSPYSPSPFYSTPLFLSSVPILSHSFFPLLTPSFCIFLSPSCVLFSSSFIYFLSSFLSLFFLIFIFPFFLSFVLLLSIS